MTGTVKVYIVKLAMACETIARSAKGFYEWRQPALPEDLCLLRDTREPSLVTIAHEEDGYLDLTDSEFAILQSALPRVVANLRPENPLTGQGE